MDGVNVFMYLICLFISFSLWSPVRWEHLIYQFGGHDHVIKYVVKKGEIVFARPEGDASQ